MLDNAEALQALNSPVRTISGRVELYDGSTLLDTFNKDDRLTSLTINRVADVGKFFGFGVCQRLNVKLIDLARELDITTANAFKVYFDEQRIGPAFTVTEVNRDENTNALSITAYDAIYKAANHTVAELGLSSYSLLEFAEACASLLGLDSVAVLGLPNGDDIFSLAYAEGANFDGTESIRAALDALAEVTQTIYYIDGESSLVFKRLDKESGAGGGEDGGGLSITWDGNTEGLEALEGLMPLPLYKISDATPTLAEIAGGGEIGALNLVTGATYSASVYDCVIQDLGFAAGVMAPFDGVNGAILLYIFYENEMGIAPGVYTLSGAVDMGSGEIADTTAVFSSLSLSGNMGIYISWDGSTDVPTIEGVAPFPLYKVSDVLLTAEDLAGAGVVVANDVGNGGFFGAQLSDCMIMQEEGAIGLLAFFDGVPSPVFLYIFGANEMGITPGVYTTHGTFNVETGEIDNENIWFTSLVIGGADVPASPDTVKWDGDLTGRVMNTGEQYCLVSSAVPTVEDLERGSTISIFAQGQMATQSFTGADVIDYIHDGGAIRLYVATIVIIPRDNYEFSSSYGTFPKAGVYFAHGAHYVSRLTINGYEGFEEAEGGGDAGGGAVLTIDKDKYFTLNSGANRRLATICHTTELGDSVSASIAETGTTQYLRNNPFIELRDDAADIIDAALAAVGGLTINQFNCTWRGNYLLEVGDKIGLITKDGAAAFSYLLDDVIEYNGALTEVTKWSYTEDEAASEDNPTSLGEVLKQTYARVDKANKKIDLVASEAAANADKISSLSLDTQGITAKVEKIEEDTEKSLEGLNDSVSQLSQKVEMQMSAEDVNIEIQKALVNGVDKVETSTGYKFDSEGLRVSKRDSDFATRITEDGMEVLKGEDPLLTANHEGVKAEDLHATTYLIIGANSRFEDYTNENGEARTGCFWIGG